MGKNVVAKVVYAKIAFAANVGRPAQSVAAQNAFAFIEHSFLVVVSAVCKK